MNRTRRGFLDEDLLEFAPSGNVEIYDMADMNDFEILEVLTDRPGTVIGAFCYSGACFDRLMGGPS